MIQIFVNPYKTLHQVSTTWSTQDSIQGYDDLEKFERAMINLMESSNGLGLAANQIGITKRFFAIGHESFDIFQKPVIIYNPEIVRQSDEQTITMEGCLSFPNVFVKVKRPKKVTVRWMNNKGETLMQHLDGMDSKCFQHELDHLDGITFDKRVSKLRWDMAVNKASKI